MGLSRSQNVEQRLPEERRSGKNPPADQIENILTHELHTLVKSGAHTHTHTRPIRQTLKHSAVGSLTFERGVVTTAANRTVLTAKEGARRRI